MTANDFRKKLIVQNQKYQLFGKWVYHRQVTISKSRPRSQTPVRNLQHPPKLQIVLVNIDFEGGKNVHFLEALIGALEEAGGF